MCYSIYLSTSFEGNLSGYNSDLIRFEKDTTGCEPQILNLLRYDHRWFVGSKSGCSCTFRHLSSIELGFGQPVDWYAEEPDEIEATKAFYDVVNNLISAGQMVDCISVWAGANHNQITRLAVEPGSVPKEAFRFFENHHFVFL